MWTVEIVAAMLAVGGFAGLVAGLFGVGGGLILVPVMLWVFQLQQFGHLPYVQHLAIGTSFAVMIFTSASSAWSQYRKQAVDWTVFTAMAPGVVAGVALGAVLAQFLPNKGLQIFFVLFTSTIAIRALMGIKPTPSRQLPGRNGLFGMGTLFGVLSSWVGIGGGSLTVPFLTFCNVGMHRAVGTSAALGWPIAVAGTLGYMWSGWGSANLPAGAYGFVYLPAVVIFAAATMLSAPWGVKLSHRLPADKLKKGFGLLLLAIAARMLVRVLS